MLITFDTSSLRTLSPDDLRTIAALAKAGLLEVCLSEIVIREWASGLAADLSGNSSMRSSLRVAGQWLEPQDPALLGAYHAVQRPMDHHNGALQTVLRKWLTECEGEELPFGSANATVVWNDYFAGAPPFSSPKNRKDIPDAMVLSAILGRADGDSLVFVCADQPLAKAAASHAHISVHDSLAEYRRSAVFAKMLEEFVKSDGWVAEAKAYLVEHTDDLADSMAPTLADKLDGYEINGHFPSDSGEATIVAVHEPTELDGLDDMSVERTADNAVQFSFKQRLTVEADLFIQKSEYYVMDDDESEHYSIWDDDWNDYYVWAQREVEVEVSGIAEIEMNGTLSSEMTIKRVVSISLSEVLPVDDMG